MALEAVVFSQPQAAAGHFGYGRGDSTTYAVPWCDLLQGGVGGGGGGFGDLCAAGEWDLDIDTWAAAAAAAPTVELGGDDWDWEALSRDYQSSDASTEYYHGGSRKAAAAPEPAGRRKRRRAKAVKNKEEIESQRMTHIAVERNRRRQMNEYLAVLRSLMPPSYAHRVRRTFGNVVGWYGNITTSALCLHLFTLRAPRRVTRHPSSVARSTT
jgi:hypothetical protein